MARLHHRGTECRPRTGEGVVERLEAVADRQARDQPVRDARRLVRALPQHVLQQQAVEAAHGRAPARERGHLRARPYRDPTPLCLPAVAQSPTKASCCRGKVLLPIGIRRLCNTCAPASDTRISERRAWEPAHALRCAPTGGRGGAPRGGRAARTATRVRRLPRPPSDDLGVACKSTHAAEAAAARRAGRRRAAPTGRARACMSATALTRRRSET